MLFLFLSVKVLSRLAQDEGNWTGFVCACVLFVFFVFLPLSDVVLCNSAA